MAQDEIGGSAGSSTHFGRRRSRATEVEYRRILQGRMGWHGSASWLLGAIARAPWLPTWDALAAAGGVAIAHGAAAGRFVSTVVGAGASPVLLAFLSEYEARAMMPGCRLRAARDLALAAPCILLIGLAYPGGSGLADVHRIVLVAGLLSLAWFTARLVISTTNTRRRARTLVIGSGVAAQRVAELASRHHENGLAIIGLLDDDGPPQPIGAPPLLGGLADLEQVLRDHAIDRVIVAFPRLRDADLVGLVRRCDRGVAVDVVPRLFDVVKPDGYLLGGLPLADATPFRRGRAKLALKRTLDVVGGLVVLTICAPLMAALAIAVWISSPGPILFWQERIGKGGHPFQVPKFRTMAVAPAQTTNEMPAILRDLSPTATEPLGIDAVVEQFKGERKNLTPIGGWLRSTSLDELPQLWCVVRGEMSFVGPRPLRSFEVASLNPWQRERLTLQPGITGLWQVLGRSDTHLEERMRLDYLYARHWSLALDLRIMLRTVPAVLLRRGAR